MTFDKYSQIYARKQQPSGDPLSPLCLHSQHLNREIYRSHVQPYPGENLDIQHISQLVCLGIPIGTLIIEFLQKLSLLLAGKDTECGS